MSMSESEQEREFDRRLTAIEHRLKKAIIGKCRVEYSAYPTDDNELPVDNLDDRAIDGRCRFVQEHDPSFGKGDDYLSREVANPTWLEVAVLANEMIEVTGDHHHVFLEGLTILGEEMGLKIVQFEMGS